MAVPWPLRAPVAPQGLWISALLAGLGFAAYAFGVPAAALALGIAAVANLLFFRNPARRAPEGEHRVVAPADGRVVEVAPVEDPFVGHATRIAIFLSVLNVHVNRAPVSGKVRGTQRGGTKFHAAFRSAASEHNVQLRTDIEAAGGERVSVVQITGLLARRIVSYAREGDELVRGEPFGLLYYGSRVELLLPRAARLLVRPGARVRAGRSVLAELARG